MMSMLFFVVGLALKDNEEYVVFVVVLVFLNILYKHCTVKTQILCFGILTFA